MAGAISHDEFMARMAKMHPTIEVLGHYSNSRTPVEFRCKTCGNTWVAQPVTLLRSKPTGCKYCSGYRKSNDEFVREVSEKNPTVQVLSAYTNAHCRIQCRCKLCGHEWDAVADSLVRKNPAGCIKCGGKDRKTTEEYQKELAERNPSIVVIGQYKSTHLPIRVRCGVCDFEWSPLASSLIGKHPSGCPRCAKSGTSFIEQFLYLSLSSLLGRDVLNRDKTTIGEELDIVIPSRGVAIEPGAWGFHAGKIDRDYSKSRKCMNEGIRLLTIYIGCPLPLPPQPFNETECWVYSQNFSYGDDPKYLKGLLTRILREFDIERNLNQADFDAIVEAARQRSRSRTHEEFVNELAKVNPGISVVGRYYNVDKLVEVECKKCGWRWEVRPVSVLNKGTGCPNCKMRLGGRRKTQEEFLAEMKVLHPTIAVLSEYKNAHAKIACSCKVCGHTWDTSPNTLLYGAKSGCPNCTKEITAAKISRALTGVPSRQRKSHETFLKEMSELHPDIEVLGTYVRAHDPISFKCRKCGQVWTANPGGLVGAKPSGCPHCSRLNGAKQGAEKRKGRPARNKKTHQQFVEEVHKKQPSIEIVGEYLSAKEHVKCKCMRCGTTWNPVAGSLVKTKPSGCPHCSRQRGNAGCRPNGE